MQECRASGHLSEYKEGSEYFVRLPTTLGRGWRRQIQLRSGLALSVNSLVHHQAHVHKTQQHSSDMPLMFHYHLAGGCRLDNDGLAGEVEEVAGKSYLYRLPNTGEIEEHPAGEHKCLHVRVAPELIYGFRECIDEFPMPLRNTLENPENTIFYHPSRTTLAQKNVLRQIFEWPYQGLARHLYLESKTLELIALHLDQVLMGPPQCAVAVKANDVDRIHAARDILIQNAIAPPSLTELAQQVGLSAVKLTRGFRQVFNTTVFNYLHDYRMKQACQLLQTGNLNIQEVARSIGYTSSDSFAKAFKKKFKMAPSLYQKRTR